MAGKSIAQTFKKYTLEPTGFWKTFGSYFQLDPSRSSGVPLNAQFRNPPPGANDPHAFEDQVTLPAGDIADNPYWKRDVRRQYPKLSVVNQADVVGLLTVGSKATPKDDVLQLGEEGDKQLVEVKQEGEKGLATFFKKDQEAISAVLPGGLPPMPSGLGQNAQIGGRKYELLKEQSYESSYPCRSFS